MKVLFSAVGKSDPMTSFDNGDIYDGSILHIIRYYKPDHIYLYMSEEMVKFNTLDDRYNRAIRKLTDAPIEHICRPNLKNVQLFDAFYDDFENIIKQIADTFGDDVEILCNVSSGTPAMKATLQSLVTFSKYVLIPIQVTDPAKGRHYRTTDLKNYDVDSLWHNNIDNLISDNRTYVSENGNFKFRVQREIMIQMLHSYEYEAVYEIAQTYQAHMSQELLDMLRLAKYRYDLNFADALLINNRLEDNSFIPYQSKPYLFEYALWLDIKLRKGELVDFIRGLNPFLLEASYALLKKLHGIDIHDYCNFNKSSGIYRLQIKKLNNTEKGRAILACLQSKYKGKFEDNSFLKETYMINILNDWNQNTKSVRDLVLLDKLREDKRNKLAHTICCVKSKDIKKDLNISIEELNTYFKRILMDLGYNTQKEWNSYDEMNNQIINKLKGMR